MIPYTIPSAFNGWSLGNFSLEKEYQKILPDTREQLSVLVKVPAAMGVHGDAASIIFKMNGCGMSKGDSSNHSRAYFATRHMEETG